MDSNVPDAKLQKFGTRSQTELEEYITQRAQDAIAIKNELLEF